ncbi:MAG TPA: DoxX family protein [Terriglobales bacterium]|nr:DoxX family protein [Terriglobales bacterium]
MSNGLPRSWGITVLRVVVGVVFLMHGWQKITVFHLAGVHHMLGSIGVPLPGIFAVILIAVEFLGGIALILGAATRPAAALLAIDMVVAILKVHLKGGFFLPMGFEFALTLLAANICMALTGGGAASVDGAISQKT